MPAQEIQLQLKISEMGKYMNIRVAKSPIIRKVNRAVETLSLELNHTLEVFLASGTTESIKSTYSAQQVFTLQRNKMGAV